MNFLKKVTGTGGEEAPTPTPAPVDAPEQTPAPTPAPAAGVGGLVGAIKNAVTGHGDSSSGDDAVATAAQPADGAADGAHGMLGNLTSSISSAAHNVTDAATSTISHAAHSVTDAASGLIGGKKDDAAAPAAGDAPAADKEGGGIGGFLHSAIDGVKGAAMAVKNEIQEDIKPSLKDDTGAAAADAAAAPAK